jgi:drug/metabolite transporter (DMT)-like permease
MGEGGKQIFIGVFYGIASATMWALYFTYSKAGYAKGLTPADYILIRFTTTLIVFLPIVWLKGIGKKADGVGFKKGAILTLCCGPLLVLFATAGYAYAPLAVGAVSQPATAAVIGLILAVLILSEKPLINHYIGSLIIFISIYMLTMNKGSSHLHDQLWFGVLSFMSAGFLWAIYTVLLKKWSVSGMDSVKYVALLGALYIPFGLLFTDSLSRIAKLEFYYLLILIIVLGLMWGLFALLAYSKAIEYLGVAKAAIFPAVVPAITIFIGIPITGHLPTTMEILGSIIASLGLICIMGGFNWIFTKTSAKKTKN